MLLGKGARLLGGGRPDPHTMIQSYELAYDEWVRRRREHYPPGQERRAPIAALVLDVDEARLLLEALDTGGEPTDARYLELHRYLKHFHSELEKHRG